MRARSSQGDYGRRRRPVIGIFDNAIAIIALARSRATPPSATRRTRRFSPPLLPLSVGAARDSARCLSGDKRRVAPRITEIACEFTRSVLLVSRPYLSHIPVQRLGSQRGSQRNDLSRDFHCLTAVTRDSRRLRAGERSLITSAGSSGVRAACQVANERRLRCRSHEDPSPYLNRINNCPRKEL